MQSFAALMLIAHVFAASNNILMYLEIERLDTVATKAATDIHATIGVSRVAQCCIDAAHTPTVSMIEEVCSGKNVLVHKAQVCACFRWEGESDEPSVVKYPSTHLQFPLYYEMGPRGRCRVVTEMDMTTAAHHHNLIVGNDTFHKTYQVSQWLHPTRLPDDTSKTNQPQGHGHHFHAQTDSKIPDIITALPIVDSIPLLGCQDNIIDPLWPASFTPRMQPYVTYLWINQTLRYPYGFSFVEEQNSDFLSLTVKWGRDPGAHDPIYTYMAALEFYDTGGVKMINGYEYQYLRTNQKPHAMNCTRKILTQFPLGSGARKYTFSAPSNPYVNWSYVWVYQNETHVSGNAKFDAVGPRDPRLHFIQVIVNDECSATFQGDGRWLNDRGCRGSNITLTSSDIVIASNDTDAWFSVRTSLVTSTTWKITLNRNGFLDGGIRVSRLVQTPSFNVSTQPPYLGNVTQPPSRTWSVYVNEKSNFVFLDGSLVGQFDLIDTGFLPLGHIAFDL
eukprot:PhF_6_TR21054/c0_g1_i1/m.30310